MGLAQTIAQPLEMECLGKPAGIVRAGGWKKVRLFLSFLKLAKRFGNAPRGRKLQFPVPLLPKRQLGRALICEAPTPSRRVSELELPRRRRY